MGSGERAVKISNWLRLLKKLYDAIRELFQYSKVYGQNIGPN